MWFKGSWTEAECETVRTFTQSMIIRAVKTMWHAAEWLEDNHDADNYFLWVEAFDPHEPYDCPKYYLDLYEKEATMTDRTSRIRPMRQTSLMRRRPSICVGAARLS